MLAIAIKTLRLLVHLSCGLLLGVLLLIEGGKRINRLMLTQWWHRRLLVILGIQVQVRGTPVQGARMTVANHISWLDIPLIGASERTQFIAKSEIRSWPIAGSLAQACGTFYIRRGKGGARPLLDRLLVHLREGGAITLFPEGTTSDGRSLLPFHGRLLAAAIEAGAPVQPVALRYAPGQDGRPVAPFIGDDDLLRHVLRVMREPKLQVELIYCAPLASRNVERDTLAMAAQAAIAAALDDGAPAARRPNPQIDAAISLSA